MRDGPGKSRLILLSLLLTLAIVAVVFASGQQRTSSGKRPTGEAVSGEMLQGLASRAVASDDPARVLREAEGALARDPRDVSALAVAIALLAKSDEEQKRLACLRRMVEMRPDDTHYLVLLARTLTNSHLYREAFPLTERILQLDPRNVDGYGLRGRNRLDTGTSLQDLRKAETDFQRALSLNPGGAMIHLQLGKLYMRLEQFDKAIMHLESAGLLTPDLPEIHFVLSEAYSRSGRANEAASARVRFADLRQDKDLATSLEKRCAADPGDFDLHLQCGLLALKRGDPERAEYYLQRARALRPGDARPRRALNRLTGHAEIEESAGSEVRL